MNKLIIYSNGHITFANRSNQSAIYGVCQESTGTKVYKLSCINTQYTSLPDTLVLPLTRYALSQPDGRAAFERDFIEAYSNAEQLCEAAK